MSKTGYSSEDVLKRLASSFATRKKACRIRAECLPGAKNACTERAGDWGALWYNQAGAEHAACVGA